MPYSRKEFEKADNKYNCPIVISYSEVLKNNIEKLKDPEIKFLNPFLPFDCKNLVKKVMELDEFKQYFSIIETDKPFDYEMFKKIEKALDDSTIQYWKYIYNFFYNNGKSILRY